MLLYNLFAHMQTNTGAQIFGRKNGSKMTGKISAGMGAPLFAISILTSSPLCLAAMEITFSSVLFCRMSTALERISINHRSPKQWLPASEKIDLMLLPL